RARERPARRRGDGRQRRRRRPGRQGTGGAGRRLEGRPGRRRVNAEGTSFMARKVVLVCDPGIDGAVAVALALLDPEIDVLGLAATAGNVPPEQATRNVHVLIEQLDPARWPRLGAALPIEYDRDNTRLHGPGGLGGADFPCAQLHHPHPSDKLLSDLVRQHPKEVTVLLLGPATAFARALDRDPDLATLVERLIIVGGAWHE